MEKLDELDWAKFRSSKKSTISHKEFTMVCELHSKYFKHKFYKPCTCNPKTIKQWIAQINDLYENNNN